MLSSAHVLAMDAKNLLDVVDSLRKRYPELFSQTLPVTPTAAAASEQPQQQQQMSQPSPQPQANRFQFDAAAPITTSTSSAADENYQIMTRQTYQNMPGQQHQHQQQQHSPSGDGELYSNQSAMGGALQSPAAPAAPATCGIYDNDMSAQQLAGLQLDNGAAAAAVAPPKPPVAAKPSNLQQKLKLQQRGQLPLPQREPLPLPLNCEPLRIVEETDTDAAAVGAVAAAAGADESVADMQLYSNHPLLPEPVACAIVQENVFHKVMSNKMA